MEIKEVIDSKLKSKICKDILRLLPNWFGLETSIAEYAEQVTNMAFYAVYSKKNPIGFAAIKVHNSFTTEVYVMGIIEEYHRQGIGRKLIHCCEDFCCTNRQVFLTVKTVDKSRENKSYEKTRLFYQSMGFLPLEVFPLLWDKENPCLFLAKNISL